MKKLLLVLAAAAFTVTLQAAPITYHTSGVFSACVNCSGNGTAVITATNASSGGTMTYTPVTGPLALDTPSSFDFGSVTVAGTTNGSISATLTISIFQDTPAPTGGNPYIIAASFSGLFTNTSTNTIVLSFSPVSGAITATGGGVTTFTLSSIYPLQTVNQGGVTTLQGSATSIPEPGSMALLGSGLLGLGFIARRRAARK